ncbi:MAG: ubiquitin-like domain-containing protein [Vulcanimicrobiaceae bacterium]
MRFESDGRITTYLTHATTVGRFLADRGIDVGPSDYLSVDQTAVVGDDMTISYRSAYPVTLRTGDHSRILLTSARTVAELLAQADVKLAADDTVHPGLDSTPAAGETIRVERITSWVKTLRKEIAASTKVRFDPALAPGKTRVLSRGSNGLSLVTYRITRHGDAKPVKYVVSKRIVRPAKPRIVLHGIDEMRAFRMAANATHDFGSHVVGSALRMVATAYVANCAGCSGITKLGMPAGHGIVAVDPHVIPLGTPLFIPGYGKAIAGDVGSAIRGQRIDLGFNSLRDALMFGRREITVYVLHQ